jgi:hypothetical protein
VVVAEADGRVVARRSGRNMVLRNGAALIASLLTGQAGAQPINRVQVGFAREAGTTDLQTLTLPDPPVDVAALRSPIGPGDFRVETDDPGAVRVTVNAVFAPTVELTDVTEAGLLAGEALYNQVLFEPLTLRAGQNVTFFWQVLFPFGH